MGTLILKCILLAKGHVDISTAVINEYAMANINRDFNETHLEADVLEGRLNSIKLQMPKYKAESFNYSIKDHEQRSLSTKLTIKNEFSSADCEIAEQNTPVL